MAQTTSAQIPAAVSEFYDRNLLTRALPLLVHDKFGQRKPIPKGNGKTIKFRKYASLATATAPLTEGVTPTAVQLSKTDITATVQFYGNYTELTDVVQLVNVENVLVEATDLLGENAGESLDEIYRSVLVAGTNVRYANSVAARVNVITKMAATDLESAINTLSRNLGKKYTTMIKAGTGVGTTPVRAAYWAICHPDVAYDIEAITGFKSVETYASQNDIQDGEFGSYKGIRFIESTKAKIWAAEGAAVSTSGLRAADSTNIEVYATLVFAKDAYGISEIRGEALKTIVKPLGSGGTSDPLDQRGTVAWKACTVAKILNDLNMVRIETGATDLS